MTPQATNGTPREFGPAAEQLTVSQICRAYPGSRGKPSLNPSTVTRWILSGCPARSGERVKLAASRVGGRWLVSPSDLQAFFAALASTRSGDDALTQVAVRQPTSVRRAASARAANELKRRGA